MKRAVYTGSFDPFTYGHMDIVRRACRIFDEVIVLVAHNTSKHTLFTPDERVEMIKESLTECDNVVVDTYEGLIINYCNENDIHTIVRGLRAVTDFEYELQVAQSNRLYSEMKLDTIFLTTSLKYSYLSSTIIKEVASFGGDVSISVPECVAKRLKEKFEK